MGVLERSEWTNGSDESMIWLGWAAMMACLLAIISAILLVLGCACCANDNAKQVPEEDNGKNASGGSAGSHQIDQKTTTTKVSTSTDVVHQSHGGRKSGRSVKTESVVEEAIPYQSRKMPKPTSHHVPLAPPGATTPPVYGPDDLDPTVNVEFGAKKSMIKV